MRETPRKERLEITLDARELVSIALGLMVVLGLVFYLGVTVGKDLAPAARAEQTTLEALDARAEAPPLEKELTFAEVLTEPARKESGAAEAEPQKAEKKAPAEKAPPEKAPAGKPAAEKAPAEKKAAAPAAAQEEAPPAAEAPRAEGGAAGEGEAPPKVYSVQVGSFPQRAEAEFLQQRLRARGLSPSIVEAEIPERGTYHRVRLGRFASRDEAKRYMEDLHRETQIEGFVVEADG